MKSMGLFKFLNVFKNVIDLNYGGVFWIQRKRKNNSKPADILSFLYTRRITNMLET